MKTNKMNDMIFQFIKKIVFLLTFTFTLSGCLIENNVDEIEEPLNGNEVTITVNIPAQQLPSTRSIADGGGEAKVETIDIFVFKPDGEGETLTQHAVGKELSQSSEGSQKYEVQFKASLASNADASTVVILANVPENLVSSALAVGGSKQAILNVLIYSYAGKWKANAGDYTPIPMYGEWALSDKGITSSMKIAGVPLTRMLARIDMVNNAAGFTLKEVFLVNYNDKGYIAPAWKTGGVLETALPANPMIPASANQQTGETNALVYAYSGSGLVGEIYTYEALKTSGIEGNTTHTNAICLIIKGRRSTDMQDSYYRIDFTESKDESGKAPGETGFNPTKVSYMPVYRNHRYLFSIDAVNSAGYAQFNDALKSLGIMNNLKTRLLVVDESGIKNVAFNGQHYLGIGDDVTLGYEMNSVASPKCETNYAYGWQLDTSKGTNGIEYSSGGSGWLSAVKSGDNINLKTLSDNLTGQNRIAYVHVKAGLLTYKLKVTQEFGIIPPDPGPDPKGDANCYIMDLNEIIGIPAFGQMQRAIEDGLLNSNWYNTTNMNFKAHVLWVDNPNLLSASSVGIYNSNGTTYLRVQTGNIYGNAVVALYDDKNNNGVYDSTDEIKWSWHIWVTDYDPDATPVINGTTHTYAGAAFTSGIYQGRKIMDRNLGATWTGGTPTVPTNKTDAEKTYGLFYQWGRKDPFPGAEKIYNTLGNETKIDKAQISSGTSNNLPNAVNKPMTYITFNGDIYGSQDWYSTGTLNHNLWCQDGINHIEGSKTAYDPCPAGWRVPMGGDIATNNPWAGFGISQPNSTGESTSSTNFVWKNSYGRLYIVGGVNAWYPASGRRFRDGELEVVGVYGQNWSSTRKNGISPPGGGEPHTAYNLSFHNGIVNPAGNTAHIYAYPVRCIKDKQ